MKNTLMTAGVVLLLSTGMTFTVCSGTFTDVNDDASSSGDQETVADTSLFYCFASLPKEEPSNDEPERI